MWRISYLEMLTISPTGTFIAAAGSDKCIFIHEFASGEKVESLYGHSEMITGMKFTNDCKRLITISGDGCVLVWRLSNDLVKNIKNKMKNQGIEPEPSIDTPLANRRGSEVQIHYPNRIQSPPNALNRTFSLPEETTKPDQGPDQPPPLRPFSPPIEPRSASVELPFAPPNIDIPTSPKSTPEFSKKKRANWGAPAKLSFMEDTTSLILQDVGEVSPDQASIRTGPYGGSESDETELAMLTPPKDIMLGEPDRSDDDSPEQEEKEDVIYAPPKLRSPTSHNKRLSHIFDIVETPIKGGYDADSAVDLDSVADDVCEEGEEEEESGEQSGEEEVMANRFIEHIEDFDQASMMSPASAHRHSMSRKFLKSSTPIGKQLPVEHDEDKFVAVLASPDQKPVKSGSDSSSSRYVSLQGTTDSASGEPLRTRRVSGASAQDLKVRKDSVTSVSKEDKVKTGNKKGIGNKLFNITGRSKDTKTPKEDKATAKKDKSKATALAKKEKTEEKMVKKPKELCKEKDVFDELQNAFNQSLAYRQKLLQGPVTQETQAQLMKSENMFQWLQSKLHESGVAREDSGSQTDLNAPANGAAMSHAEHCAELCAERILAIVEKKLSAQQSNA